jgi:SpoVK/Ycf46/Vps4 family AAA+-type ATPase
LYVFGILDRVFNTPLERMFGDLLKGKHGGVVILACGEPGVGKTLTAEIYAETTERPLYVLELGELGTNPSDVESWLQRVFARVTRWNAVLQFDECEIFLARRGTDLERSAIVGIFLRLLDYYRGLLFLTTNRPEVLDEAVLSRVMLKLNYPHLVPETRAKIWNTMFAVAGLRGEGWAFDKIAQLDLNGRQIRNITRLAKILNPGGIVNHQAICEALHFSSGASLPE